MPSNLPPMIGHGAMSPGNPQISAHAQNLSTTKLNQHKEREAATVSMDRVIKKKESRSGQGPTTSIDHVLHGNLPSNTGSYPGYSDQEQEEIRTRLRYQHIRKMIKERQAEAKNNNQ